VARGVTMLKGMGGMQRQVVQLTISADTQNYNVRTAAGSPSGSVDVFLTINAGVKVGSTSRVTPALRWGTGWTAGSTFTGTSSGDVVGCAGNGGNGSTASNTAQSGSAGGDAMDCDGNAVTYDNTNGRLLGAGGGGAGGPGDPAGAGLSQASGGGGGGGRGYNGGTAGSAGASGGATGSNGTAGSYTAAGTGGAGSTNTFYGTAGLAGANGGDFGAAGGGRFRNGFDSFGGAAGKACNLNGGSLTLTGGNNSSQVKGAVS
jgi:hypothetical protein